MKKHLLPKAILLLALAGLALPASRGAGSEATIKQVPHQAGPSGTLNGTLTSVWLRRYSMVVYLESVPGKFPPPSEKPTLDQQNKMFVPHLLPVLEGTTIHYVNHDDTKHNVYFIQPDGQNVNLGTGDATWWKDHRMDQPGVYVHRCNIHAEMSSYIVNFKHPYFVLLEKRASQEPAKFRFEGIPPGDYNVRVWCEKFYDQPDHKFNQSWKVSIPAGQESAVEVKP